MAPAWRRSFNARSRRVATVAWRSVRNRARAASHLYRRPWWRGSCPARSGRERRTLGVETDQRAQLIAQCAADFDRVSAA